MQTWSKGVELELHGLGRYRTVTSTEDAANCLLQHWPGGTGKAHQAARQACLDALEGTVTPDVAREAFIKAARASKIHIRSTESPRPSAVRGGKSRISHQDSAAFRKANHDAMEAIRTSVSKLKDERHRFFGEEEDKDRG